MLRRFRKIFWIESEHLGKYDRFLLQFFIVGMLTCSRPQYKVTFLLHRCVIYAKFRITDVRINKRTLLTKDIGLFGCFCRLSYWYVVVAGWQTAQEGGLMAQGTRLTTKCNWLSSMRLLLFHFFFVSLKRHGRCCEGCYLYHLWL